MLPSFAAGLRSHLEYNCIFFTLVCNVQHGLSQSCFLLPFTPCLALRALPLSTDIWSFPEKEPPLLLAPCQFSVFLPCLFTQLHSCRSDHSSLVRLPVEEGPARSVTCHPSTCCEYSTAQPDTISCVDFHASYSVPFFIPSCL